MAFLHKYYNQYLALFIGRAPSGRAIRCKSSLVPRSGLYTAIPHALRIITHYVLKQTHCRQLLSVFVVTTLLVVVSCNSNKTNITNPIFTTLTPTTTGLNFINTLHPTPEFNILKYMYYYNGAGVATADFNNDGKVDIYFASNQEQNKLYINQGNLTFTDVTAKTNLPNDSGWSTGVSVVDINNDGLQDIYVCRVSGYKQLVAPNLLLICQGITNGIPTYKDAATAYGLNFSGYSTQATFFDYDLDGDLDCYLLNHSVNHNGNFAPRANFINTYDSLAGDRLYRNDGGKYINITKQSGINSSKIGYGLGIAIADVNTDGYPDIYIGNDFHENDYLYINQRNGTYKDELSLHIQHTSQFTMGVDIADINNDAQPDIVSMDMLPNDPYIMKRSLGEDDYQNYLNKKNIGYAFQFSRNNLQLNQGNGMFSETAFYSGISATDWSWSALFADFNNDALKDLFISNGIPKRLNDIDYINYISNDIIQQKIQSNTIDTREMELVNKFPEIKLPNHFYINKGNAQFEDKSNQVLNNTNTFSNGAALADFDNDGQQDVVVNNINDPALLYHNNNSNKNYYTNLVLQGDVNNKNAIGAKIIVYQNNTIATYENYPTKGFLSSMQVPLHIAFGISLPDSILCVWPNNTYQRIAYNSAAKQQVIAYNKGLPVFNYKRLQVVSDTTAKAFTNITAATKLAFVHRENDFNEYNRETLLPKMYSKEGPAIAVADVNNDGLEDVFFGAAKWQKPALFFQNRNGTFTATPQPSLFADSTCEDVDATFTDINNDGYKDLIVATGGNEFYGTSRNLLPRLYLNNSKGIFVKKDSVFSNIYTTQSTISSADFNGDGLQDVFIGSRCVPFTYGTIPNSYLLLNTGNATFKDVTTSYAKGLQQTGFVTYSTWANINKDTLPDLIVAKEWGGIDVYINTNGKLVAQPITTLLGWWNCAIPADVDADGDLDIIAGNQGLNSRLQPNAAQPVSMYYNDFDNNETKEQIITYYQNGKEIPLASKMELEKQMPFLKKKYLYAQDFAKSNINELIGGRLWRNATKYTANYFDNTIFYNNGSGQFTPINMPWQAQFSCIKTAVALPASVITGMPNIIVAGNFYEQAVNLNHADAEYGTTLINYGKKQYVAQPTKGMVLPYEIRHIVPITIAGKLSYICSINNGEAQVFQ